MRNLTTEELIVRKIESGIRGIDLGTKKPHEVNILKELSRLSMLNDGLFDELQDKYTNTLKMYERKKIAELYK
jgi:hypothetical protein